MSVSIRQLILFWVLVEKKSRAISSALYSSYEVKMEFLYEVVMTENNNLKTTDYSLLSC